jgi:outer membrane murein-binding lipoprotein Lpp
MTTTPEQLADDLEDTSRRGFESEQQAQLRRLKRNKEAAALIRTLSAQVEQLSRERDELAKDLKLLQDKTEFIAERRAQISHRLWAWAHEELSEPLKTRYFNIVANGTADVMEQPTYAQQYNGQKYRADAAEAERDSLRAELAALRGQSTEIIVRQSILLGEYSKCLMPFDDDMAELIAIGKLVDVLIPPPSPSSAEGA